MQDTFGDFKVLDRVGAGTGSEVFRARDTRAGRTAAIKVLTSDLAMDPVVGAPFVDEAYLAQKLGHPSAATLYDIGEQDGHPHLVYEFIQGQTLTALLAGNPINPRRALELATQVADALAEAHAMGLVHRGLRSDKVMVSLKGNAKVLDFGLGHYAAAIMRQLAAGGGAGAATAARTMSYWAPEQHTGLADARSDIYSLGLILLEMLTGRVPPGPATAPDIASAPAATRPLLARMLADDPAARVDSAATVAAELRQLTLQLEAQRDTPPAPAPAPAAAPQAAPVAATAVAAPSASSPGAAVPARKASAPAAAAAPKKAPGVTVTAPPPAPPTSPAQSAAGTTGAAGASHTGKSGNQPGPGKKAGGKKATARPAVPVKTSPAAAPRHPAADQTVDISGLGKTTVVIMIGVAVLMALIYFYFG